MAESTTSSTNSPKLVSSLPAGASPDMSAGSRRSRSGSLRQTRSPARDSTGTGGSASSSPKLSRAR